MSIKGNAESYVELRGSISMSRDIGGSLSSLNTMGSALSFPDTIVGKSAYEVAVMNGFVGTEAEWLASLKGEKPIKGVDYFTEDDVLEIINEVKKDTALARIGHIAILANNWVGETSPYSQVVEIDGATENSQVDLTPSVEQLAIFHQKDLAFVTENDGGVVTVYAIGQKPENDYIIQVTITEVTI